MKDFSFRQPSIAAPAAVPSLPTVNLRAAPPATPSLPTVNWTGSNPYFASSSSVPTGHSFGQPSISAASAASTVGSHSSAHPIAPSAPTPESINARHGGKVVGTSQIGVDQEGTSLAVKKAISDAKALTQYRYNTLGDTRAINLSSSDVRDSDLSTFCTVIDSYKFNLEALYLNDNAIGDDGIAKLIPAIKGSKYTCYMQVENGQPVRPAYIVAHDLRFFRNTDPTDPQIITQSIVFLNLANNKIGDPGARTIADALASGKLPNTKVVDAHGNDLTNTGEVYFVRAMKSMVQDVVVLTQEIHIHSELLFGTKAQKIAHYKALLKQGIDKGANHQAIVVDTGFWGQVVNTQNEVETNFKTFFGFIRCKWNPEELAQSYAEGKLIAKLPKTLGKLVSDTVNIKSTVSCYLEAHNDAWTSTSGQQVLANELHIMGEHEFCSHGE